MASLSVRSTQSIAITPQAQTAKKQHQLSDIAKQPQMVQDNFSIKKGLLPSLKGGAAGALGAGGGTTALLAATGNLSGFDGIIGLPVAIAAGIGGTAGGVAAANFTDSKGKGAMIGGVTGAVIGAASLAFALRNGNAAGFGAALGAVAGGVAGAAGGVFGSMVSEKQ